jgi:hypothetical protein
LARSQSWLFKRLARTFLLNCTRRAGRSHIYTHTTPHTHHHHASFRQEPRRIPVEPLLGANVHFTWCLFGHHPKRIRVWEHDATEHFVCGVFKLTEMHHSLIESEAFSTRAHFAQFKHALQSGRLRHIPKNRDCGPTSKNEMPSLLFSRKQSVIFMRDLLTLPIRSHQHITTAYTNTSHWAWTPALTSPHHNTCQHEQQKCLSFPRCTILGSEIPSLFQRIVVVSTEFNDSALRYGSECVTLFHFGQHSRTLLTCRIGNEWDPGTKHWIPSGLTFQSMVAHTRDPELYAPHLLEYSHTLIRGELYLEHRLPTFCSILSCNDLQQHCGLTNMCLVTLRSSGMSFQACCQSCEADCNCYTTVDHHITISTLLACYDFTLWHWFEIYCLTPFRNCLRQYEQQMQSAWFDLFVEFWFLNSVRAGWSWLCGKESQFFNCTFFWSRSRISCLRRKLHRL